MRYRDSNSQPRGFATFILNPREVKKKNYIASGLFY